MSSLLTSLSISLPFLHSSQVSSLISVKFCFQIQLLIFLEETGLRRVPENIDVNRKLALIYQDMGNSAKALEHMTKAAKTNSKHPELKQLAIKG